MEGCDVTYDDILRHGYWYHRIPLRDGRVTPGRFGPSRWDSVGLPECLDGKTVLDVGAFDGLLAFEAERRGAGDVLATDLWAAQDQSDGDPTEGTYPPSPAGFELAKRYMDSDVSRRNISIYDLSPSTVGTFDYVVCLGVVDQLKYPLRAIERLSSVADERIVFSAPMMSDDAEWPALRFLYSEADRVPIWWSYNRAVLRGLFEATGCEITEIFHPDPVDPARSENVTVGSVTAGSVLYRTPELEEAIGDVTERHTVEILHRTSSAARIHDAGNAPPGATPRQAWVPTESITDRSTSASTLFGRARSAMEMIKRKEVVPLATAIASLVSERLHRDEETSRAVVHATPDSSVESPRGDAAVTDG